VFFEARAFNGDLSAWNVGQVTTMSDAFHDARAFNGDLSAWNVGRVTTMNQMFCMGDPGAFNGDISAWNVSTVTDMSRMFAISSGTSGFTRTLCDVQWINTSDIGARIGCCAPGTFMAKPNLSPFEKATACEICPTGRTNDVDNSITRCTIATVSIPDKSALQIAVGKFADRATIAKYGVIQSWDVSLITNMYNLFKYKSTFNENISAWNVGAVTNMQSSTCTLSQDHGLFGGCFPPHFFLRDFFLLILNWTSFFCFVQCFNMRLHLTVISPPGMSLK